MRQRLQITAQSMGKQAYTIISFRQDHTNYCHISTQMVKRGVFYNLVSWWQRGDKQAFNVIEVPTRVYMQQKNLELRQLKTLVKIHSIQGKHVRLRN